MRAVDVITRKRDGQALTRAEIDFFVSGVTTGAWPDYQVSALLMAIVLRGMTSRETADLADAMVRSGDRVDLSGVSGAKVGKHSTGGVGDKVSLVVAPLVASCGAVVPKMSGRGLGHSGGTIDKLESIPGFRVNLTIDEFKAALRAVGTCIVSQTSNLAPADKKIYALRDVTGTVESLPLIAASIMSKKLAEGIGALVLDVKCGDGAFMKDLQSARALAESMVSIGSHAGVRTEAVITDMNAPLGCAVGNSVEIVECVETLKGNGPNDLVEVAETIATRMLLLAGVRRDESDAREAVSSALRSGAALETFGRMVAHQGGDRRVIDERRLLPGARFRSTIGAESSGYIAALQASAIGRASMMLGAGREHVTDSIDYGAGLMVRRGVGEAVTRGEPVLELLYNDERRIEEARRVARSAIDISPEPPPARRLVLETV